MTKSQENWTLEAKKIESSLISEQKFSLICPLHKNQQILIEKMAPDVGFLDLTTENIVQPENIRRGNLVGRGAFGFVFNGFIKQRVRLFTLLF